MRLRSCCACTQCAFHTVKLYRRTIQGGSSQVLTIDRLNFSSCTKFSIKNPASFIFTAFQFGCSHRYHVSVSRVKTICHEAATWQNTFLGTCIRQEWSLWLSLCFSGFTLALIKTNSVERALRTTLKMFSKLEAWFKLKFQTVEA